MALELIGTAVAALLLLAVTLAIARGIDWRSYEIFSAPEEDDLAGALAGSPAVWVLVFLLLALGLPAVALLAVGDFGVASPGVVTAAIVAFAAVVLAYLVGGTYVAARDRNASPAAATLAAALIVGTLLLVAISGKLLLGL